MEFGVAARGIATAAMDLSDGLAGDLPKLARASGLAAHVDVERLPLSRGLAGLRAVRSRRATGRSAPAMTTNCCWRSRRAAIAELAALAAQLDLRLTADR